MLAGWIEKTLLTIDPSSQSSAFNLRFVGGTIEGRLLFFAKDVLLERLDCSGFYRFFCAYHFCILIYSEACQFEI